MRVRTFGKLLGFGVIYFSEGLVEEDSAFYLMTTEKSAENSAARCKYCVEILKKQKNSLTSMSNIYQPVKQRGL